MSFTTRPNRLFWLGVIIMLAASVAVAVLA